MVEQLFLYYICLPAIKLIVPSLNPNMVVTKNYSSVQSNGLVNAMMAKTINLPMVFSNVLYLLIKMHLLLLVKLFCFHGLARCSNRVL